MFTATPLKHSRYNILYLHRYKSETKFSAISFLTKQTFEIVGIVRSQCSATRVQILKTRRPVNNISPVCRRRTVADFPV